MSAQFVKLLGEPPQSRAGADVQRRFNADPRNRERPRMNPRRTFYPPLERRHGLLGAGNRGGPDRRFCEIIQRQFSLAEAEFSAPGIDVGRKGSLKCDDQIRECGGVGVHLDRVKPIRPEVDAAPQRVRV